MSVVVVASFSKSCVFILFKRIRMVAFSNRSTLDWVLKSLHFRGPFSLFPCKQKVKTERFGCVFK